MGKDGAGLSACEVLIKVGREDEYTLVVEFGCPLVSGDVRQMSFTRLCSRRSHRILVSTQTDTRVGMCVCGPKWENDRWRYDSAPNPAFEHM